MYLCIAEKPSVAREIASVLGCTQNHHGWLSGGDYCVTWVYGHLCELKEPHDYDPILKKWDLSLLPILPERFDVKLKGEKSISQQFNIIKNLVEKCTEVINCGDAGQEGELIQRWVLRCTGITRPVKRLWISSLTEEAIREGFNNLRPGSDFDKLYAAGYARAVGDWLLGMNATRLYTMRFAGRGALLSIGRVQTPTLALIVNRYYEIQNFKPETYWELKTIYRDVVFNSTKGRYLNIEEANQALAKIGDNQFLITDIQKKDGLEAPPRLFDLTSLQVECNRKFSFSADDTLRIVQSLYEKKVSTYPRVDTTYLSDDIYPKVPKILSGLAPYMALIQPLLTGKPLKKSKKVFDNSKVTDHHAIIPTGVNPLTLSLTREEKLVYDQIARRFIANFYPDSKVSTTTVIGISSDVPFKAVGRQIIEPAWRVVYGQSAPEQEEEKKKGTEEQVVTQVMPDFQKGEMGPHKPSLQEKQTQPPKPYTEATLLRAMETAGKQVDDDELCDLMKDNGIGRPSTRAAIIETLFKRRYIEKQKKNLIPTMTGLQLISTIKNELLKSVELTGQWEKKLRQIEKGEYEAKAFVNEMREMVSALVQDVLSDNMVHRIELVSVGNKKPTERSGNSGKDASDNIKEKSGGQTKSVKTNQPMVCPRCGRPFVKGKSAWGCSGYREGCTLIVPFEVYGKSLSESHVRSLLTKRQTSVIKGLTVGENKFDGRLAFDSTFSLIVKAEDSSSVDISELKCPQCGSPLMKGRSAWGCSRYKDGCRFVVPFVFMNKQITMTHLAVLCKKGRTAVINGFVDETGTKQSGHLVIDNGVLKLEK